MKRRILIPAILFVVSCTGIQGITAKAAQEQGNPVQAASEENENENKESGQSKGEKDSTDTPGKNEQDQKEKETQKPQDAEKETVKQVLEPVLKVGRRKMEQKIMPGDKFQVILTLDNSRQSYTLKNVEISLEGTKEMVLQESSATILPGDISGGKTVECSVKLKTEKTVSSSAQTLRVKVRYDYDTPSGIVHGQKEEQIIIPTNTGKEKTAQPKGDGPNTGGGETDGGSYGGGGDSPSDGGDIKEIDVPTPNVIISRFEYGKKVTAGKDFTLKLELKNTSCGTAVENMILSLDLGEALSLADGTNTFYIDKIPAGGSVTEVISLKALANGKPEDAKIDLNLKYEYVVKKTRSQATASQKLGLPFSQPDRFLISEAKPDGEVHQDSEATISLPYVNKGKGTISNVEAKLETGMEAEERYKYLGNFESGASGTIDFLVTPHELGKQTAIVTITYEDSDGKQQQIEKKVELEALEPSDEYAIGGNMMGIQGEGMDYGAQGDVENSQNPGVWGWAAAAIGIIAIVLGGFFWHRKRKSARETKLLEELEDDF